MLSSKNSRRTIIAGNWKMYKTRAEAVELATEIVQAVSQHKSASANMPQVILFPPFTSLEYVSTAVGGTEILVGAQNMNQHENGGYTGEISADMIIDCGARVVLIGHSERRHVFHETDTDVNAKLKTVVQKKLTAILCVGETLEQREQGKTDIVIAEQMSAALKSITFSDPNSLVIAYEPVWSIGTGKVCEAEEANRVTGKIREMLQSGAATSSFADQIPVLYGGSVKPSNVAGLLGQDNIDGALVGGASLTTAEFVPIIEAGIGCYQVGAIGKQL
jgi:triosephosphate isomerase